MVLILFLFHFIFSSIILSPQCLWGCQRLPGGWGSSLLLSLPARSLPRSAGVHFEARVLFFLCSIWQLSSPKSVFWQAAFMEGQSETSGQTEFLCSAVPVCAADGSRDWVKQQPLSCPVPSKSKYSSVVLARWTDHHIQVTHCPSGILQPEKQFLVPCMNPSPLPCSRSSSRHRAIEPRHFAASLRTPEAFTALTV